LDDLAAMTASAHNSASSLMVYMKNEGRFTGLAWWVGIVLGI
jgi:uncharacterized integral membrane protein